MSGEKGQHGPHSLKCSQCKKSRESRLAGRAEPGNLIRTGKTRVVRHRTAHECVCLTCEHVGWYTHRDAGRRPFLMPRRA